jgi:hypothetical protein
MLIKTERNGHLLEHDEESHIYLLDGKILTGVTSIISGGYPKSQRIVDWQIKEGVKWFWKEVAGADPTLVDKRLPDLLKQAPTAFKTGLDEAGDIGTEVHDYCYCTEKGLPVKDVSQHPQVDIIKKCCQQFDEWRAANKDTVIALEELICSPTYMYAGRFDRLANRNGVITLSDYKTSSSFYITQFVQMAAYAIAIEEWMNVVVEDIEIVRFDKKAGTLTTRNLSQLADTVKLKPKTAMKRLKAAFASILETYKFKDQFDKYIRQ